MKALLHPIVPVVVCIAVAVWLGAAAQIHAMPAADASSAGEPLELSISAALMAGHKAWSALDFWIP
jgi:hypothetical protein